MGENSDHDVHVSGSPDVPKDNKITLTIDRDGVQLFLEIAAPGVVALRWSDQDVRVRHEIQWAVDAIQHVLNSPSALSIQH